jgi:hypothetical protein
MARRDANTLQSLLESLVEKSPVAQALGLVHVTKVAGAFGLHRASVEREIRLGFLSKPVRFRGGAYIAMKDVLSWWHGYQTRPYHRGPGVRARSKKARAATATIPEVNQEQLQA